MAETWIINSRPDIGVFVVSETINFVSNNITYNTFNLNGSTTQADANIKYDNTTVYSYMFSPVGPPDFVWSNQAYRTVTFETAPSGDLLTWLETNAEKQIPTITDKNILMHPIVNGSQDTNTNLYPRTKASNIIDKDEYLQGKLTAGENITIEDNVISAQGGGSSVERGTLPEATSDTPDLIISGGKFYFKNIYYALNVTVQNVTNLTDIDRIDQYGSVELLFSADGESYTIPDSSGVSVSGADYVWTKISDTSGKLVVSNPSGNVSVEVVGEQASIPMPTKGQIITMTLGNATPEAGTNNQYRVLSVNGTQAEVVAMFDASTSQAFGSDNIYSGSDLDIYLNTAWYDTLNSTAKSAIVSKTITQYQYASGSYDANIHASYADYSTKSVEASGLTRNIYALDVEDIENYFNHTFSTADIWEMFWNVRSQPSTVMYPWLRSAYSDDSIVAFCVYGDSGYVDSSTASNDYAARPAFTIDLSKISWS